MNPNKALWEKGDFTRIAASMRASGEAFASTLGVTPGLRVLDLGCGDGTTAIPTAQLGAEVLGVDIAGNLVVAGARRARDLGLDRCRFQEGDACRLDGLENDAFDLVVSLFGAMFAPRPFDVARVMVRVARPGGRIVMANWIPGDPTLVAQILKISSVYAPPPPEGSVSPTLWGVEGEVEARFASAGVAPTAIAFRRERWAFTAPKPPTALVEDFRRYYGPTMTAFEAARANGREAALTAELNDLFERQNTSGEPGVTTVAATYLRVTVAV